MRMLCLCFMCILWGITVALNLSALHDVQIGCRYSFVKVALGGSTSNVFFGQNVHFIHKVFPLHFFSADALGVDH